MSLFHPVNLVCPACGALVTMPAVGSVNADRRPDLREAILADRFQDTTCAACGHSFRLQPEFNFLDAGRRQWIAALPAHRILDWAQIEAETLDLFSASYGTRAPKAAQAVGETLDVRLTFGWPAVREKILARQEGLDDVSLECLKLDIMRTVPQAPIGVGIELRLTRIDASDMVLTWLSTRSEEAVQRILVPRAAFDHVDHARTAWAGIRARLTDGPFVDMQKFALGDGRPAEAPQESVAPP